LDSAPPVLTSCKAPQTVYTCLLFNNDYVRLSFPHNSTQFMFVRSLKLLSSLLCLFVSITILTAQPNSSVKESYTKLEQLIPMRDGVKLFTAIYIPKDSSEAHPILMQRTPYSCRPYGQENYPRGLGSNPAFMEGKYIFVFQDVRGRHMSEGNFTEVTPNIANKKTTLQVDESSDTYDTIEWLLQNIRGHNGNVGLYGISYPGFYATAALPNAHPAIKAVSPQAPVTDEFEGDDVYHRGAFFLMDNVGFLNFFNHPRTGPQQTYPPLDTNLNNITNAYDFYLKLGPIKNINDRFFKNKSVIWNEYIAHDTKDEYWQSRNIRPYLKNIKPAVLTIGGWFDAEDMFGALRTYEAIERQNKKNNNFLMMGPWTHGGWSRGNTPKYATYNFGMNPAELYRSTEAAFFNFYLKGKGNPAIPEASIFFTGSNQWRSFNEWPLSNTKDYNLYLNAGKKLSTNPAPERTGFEEYISDPANPVPYTAEISGDRDNNYLGADQRFSADRPDVLVFETDALTNDITLAGPVIARLFVTTTGTDADFVVKLIDVLPDSNTQQMVRAEVLRGKFRNSFSKPTPFEPGKTTPVKLTLNDVAHTFKAGHKIMVHIQSSWFPLVDRNPQQFMRIPDANAEDFQRATIKIERNGRYSSVIQCQRIVE
jgi:putative CocE/NonD family hydrolase